MVMDRLSQKDLRKKVAAAGFGNALEWYDFGVYGFFATAIGVHFFPESDPFAALLSAFAAFAVGYLARPVGGVVLGHVGDKFGRKPVMMFSITMMGLATFSIGILPSFETIGIAAPIMLVMLRLLQGFAVAGEYSGSTVFLIEHAPDHRRGFISSWTIAGQFAGLLLGSGTGALVGVFLTDAQLQEWGWRIPFLLSSLLATAGLLFRRGLEETPAIEETPPEEGSPAIRAIRQNWRDILRYVSLILMSGIGFYVLFVYAVADLELHMHLSSARALDINTFSLFIIMLAVPVYGLISDHIGRKPLALFAAIGAIVFSWPLWWLMHQNSFVLILIGQATAGLILAAGWSVYGLIATELVSTRLRVTLISIANGIAYGIFGGLTPLIATYLVKRTGDDFTPVYIVMVAAFLSLAAILMIPETSPNHSRKK